jgi:ectoine hydroxylase-related dioxygenase (phytanoyl-CoA dioxygenase family)
MNGVVVTLARYLCGKSVILSDMLGMLKQKDDTPTHLLHTDQHGTPPPLPQYAQVLNITWTLTDYTRDNGAVAIVPGSHRFGRMPASYEKDFLKKDALVPAIPVECEAGSLIVWGGTTWHGSFPRVSPGIRMNLIMVFNRAYMKQIRDFPATTPKEVLDRNTPEFARLLGFESPYPFDVKGPDSKKVMPFIEAGRTPWS